MSEPENVISLPRLPQPNIGRPKKIDLSIINDMTAVQLVELLEENHGDLNKFFKHFYCMPELYQHLLSRVYMVLNSEGNTEHAARWQQALRCHKLAKMAIMENQVLDHMAKMPTKHRVNKDTGEVEELSLDVKDYMSLAGLFLTDMKEEARTRGKKPQQNGDPIVAEVEGMLKRMKENKTVDD